MKISFFHLISLLWLLLFLVGFVNAVSASEEYQTYIIHLDHTHKPMSFLTHESWHRSILKSLLSSPADYKELLLYSYNHVMHGFSARLTHSQLTEIEKSPAHLAIYPESLGKLLTTYFPQVSWTTTELWHMAYCIIWRGHSTIPTLFLWV